MNNITVKDVMIPVSEYIRIRENETLYEAMQLLQKKLEQNGGSRTHHDLLVEENTGRIIGKVTMIDIINFMEPQYKKIITPVASHVLESSFVQKVFKDFNLWSESLGNLCHKAASAQISKIMHRLNEADLVNDEATLDSALHRYIMGVHQPILVTNREKTVVGVLRLGDVYEKVRQGILSCEIK